jgi:hypothetical protein
VNGEWVNGEWVNGEWVNWLMVNVRRTFCPSSLHQFTNLPIYPLHISTSQAPHPEL